MKRELATSTGLTNIKNKGKPWRILVLIFYSGFEFFFIFTCFQKLILIKLRTRVGFSFLSEFHKIVERTLIESSSNCYDIF